MSSITARVRARHKQFDVTKIKGDFPIFSEYPSLAYLDSAATSQTPRAVLDAMNGYYTKFRSNINRGIYPLGERATEEYEEARKKIAEFIGAKPNEVVFTSGTTAASNMLIRSIENSFNLKHGDEVVTTVLEHHSNLIPLQEFAKRQNLTLKHVSITRDFDLDYGEAERLVTTKTKIVSFTHASNVTGTITDVKRIAGIAHKVGAMVIVDAAEAVGHVPVDVKEINADFLYFSGHKMLGPTGIGVLYGKREMLENLTPSVFGGGIVENVDLASATWKGIPERFEAGTQNIAGAIGLSAAVEYIEHLGVQNIHNHVQGLTRYAIGELENIKGIRIFAQKDAKKNAGIISFAVDGVHPHDIAEIAGRDGVAIRAGHHCAQPLMNTLGVNATARASFYLYNDMKDISSLIAAINKVKKLFKA